MRKIKHHRIPSMCRISSIASIALSLVCILALSEVKAAEVCYGTSDSLGNDFLPELSNISFSSQENCDSEQGSVSEVTNRYISQNYELFVNTEIWQLINLPSTIFGNCTLLVDSSFPSGDVEIAIVWNGIWVFICPSNENVSVRLIETPLTITEGGSKTYTVVLTGNPDGPVNVTPRSDNPDVTLAPSSLSFDASNWETPKTVTVNAAHDDDTTNDIAILTHAVSGLGDLTDGGAVSITVEDDDQDVRLSVSSLTITEGGSNTYTVVLTGNPDGPVNVTPRSDNPDVTLSPSSLSFDASNWETPKTVTVNAAHDDDTTNDIAILTHAVSGLGDLTDGGAVSITVEDDDQDVRLSVSSLTITEGGSNTYTVVLTGNPDGPVNVTPRSDNPDVTLSPSSLSFDASNWETPKTVTVNAAHDDDTTNDIATLTHAVSGLGDLTDGGAVSVTVEDEPDESSVAIKAAVTNTLATVTASAVSNVTTNIGARFSAARGGTSLSVAGQSVAQSKLLESVPWSSHWDNEGNSRTPSSDDLLRSTVFQIALGAAEGAQAQAATPWTVWGRGDLQYFSSDPDQGSGYDGNLRAVYLGLDAQIDERWLAGVAVSRTLATADYTLGGDGADGQGQMEVSLTSLLPYIRFAPNQKSELWVILGSGWGGIENTRTGTASSAQETSDLTFWMAAAGGRHALGTNGPLGWALLGDMGFGRVETEDGVQAVSGLTVDTRRVRLGVEGSFTTELESGGSLTAFMEVAGRYDGSGDDVEETGIELSPGLYFSDPGSGFGVEVRGRALVLHSAENYKEYGLSATASLSPRSDGLGLSLSLSPSWGNDTKGAETLWRDDAIGQLSSHLNNRNAMFLDARVGYGIRAMSGILTPFGEFSIWDEDSRQLRIGTRFNRRHADPGALSLELSGGWHESSGRDLEQRAGVIGRIRF